MRVLAQLDDQRAFFQQKLRYLEAEHALVVEDGACAAAIHPPRRPRSAIYCAGKISIAAAEQRRAQLIARQAELKTALANADAATHAANVTRERATRVWSARRLTVFRVPASSVRVQAASVAADEEARRLKEENAVMLAKRKLHNARMKELEVRPRNAQCRPSAH